MVGGSAADAIHFPLSQHNKGRQSSSPSTTRRLLPQGRASVGKQENRIRVMMMAFENLTFLLSDLISPPLLRLPQTLYHHPAFGTYTTFPRPPDRHKTTKRNATQVKSHPALSFDSSFTFMMMSRHGLPPSSSAPSLPAQSPDFDLQTRLYAFKPLPDPPPQGKKHKRIRRKPVASDARVVVGETARFPMAQQKQDAPQNQELDTLSAHGRSLSSDAVTEIAPVSPSHKSPFRSIPYSTPTTPSPKGAANQKRSSAKVHQLTGIDIDVFNDSPWKYGNFQMDTVSDSSSLDSQESTNNTSTMKSWHTMTDDAPPLENDPYGHSNKVESWESRSPRGSASLHPSSSLQRNHRTHRKSRDKYVLADYHRIVTDIASPTRSSTPDLPTVIAPRDDGMPPDFDIMLNEPRRAPRPPSNPLGPDGERLGSYFDFNSDEDEEQNESDGIFSTSGRGRDSFLGMLLGRGAGEDGSPHQRSASVSTGAGRPSSELDPGFSDSAASEARKARREGSRRAALRGLMDWAKKDGPEGEMERRRQELRQKITIQGGRRL